MQRRGWIRRFSWTLLVVIAVVSAAGLVAPYLFVEMASLVFTTEIVSPEPARPAKGTMFDDYFVVEELDPRTFAIGEPRYYQANYSYLILGEQQALLFDAGSGTRSLRSVVESLTDLPVTVLPSHLHYDHLAGVSGFDRVAMLDLEESRSRTVDGRYQPGRYDFLGMFDGIETPSVTVSSWLAPGSSIDLGGRSVTVLATPGHTPHSVSLYDREAGWLFTGDFIYPTELYAFLPGASIPAYQASTRTLLDTLPASTILWSAHCCRRDEGYAAPWLTMADLRDLDQALAGMSNGQLRGEGFYPRRFPVNDQMTLATGFRWNRR